jgi:hypothetical protein
MSTLPAGSRRAPFCEIRILGRRAFVETTGKGDAAAKFPIVTILSMLVCSLSAALVTG